MKRNGGILLIGAMIVIGACEVVLHWLFGKGVFPRLLAIYLMADSPSGKHTVMGMVDNAAPAVALGWVNGWVGFPRWSVRKLIATTLVLATFVATLVPVYSVLIGPHLFGTAWGMPKSTFQSLFDHLFDAFTAFLIAGMFTYGAYVFRRDWKRGRSGSPTVPTAQ